MNSNLKKNFSFVSTLTIFSLCFYVPLGALAQTDSVGGNAAEATAQATSLQTSGAQKQGGTGTSSTTPANAAVGGLAAGVASCSVGALAGQMLAGTISKAVGSAFGLIKSGVTGAVSGVVTDKAASLIGQYVPVGAVGNTEQHLISLDNNQANINKIYASTAASPGGWDGIATSFTDLFSAPSLNAIGFCIGNEIIQYVTKSTINWINTGFKGSPVFITNTNEYFKGIQEQELGNFVNGVANGSLGINLCQPFKVAVLTNTLGGYGGSGGYNPLNCSLSQIKNNYNQFTGGDWNSGGFPGWFELIQQPNNIYGATLAAQDQAYINISTKQNTALIDLNWAKGYRDFNICQDKSIVNKKTGLCANGQPSIKGTGGDFLENQINAVGASGRNRLNIATSFDQIVSALVNELIKISLDKVLTSPTSNSK